jgi:hypothetical protein
LKPQTTAQVLRCLILGRYTAAVEGGELKIRGPQPLAGPLPAGIRTQRDELNAFLDEYCGGVWPPAEGLDLSNVLDQRRMRRKRRFPRPAA